MAKRGWNQSSQTPDRTLPENFLTKPSETLHFLFRVRFLFNLFNLLHFAFGNVIPSL